jgi:undecaprenyl-diphosphatase
MLPSERRLSREAFALGVVQGPAELLPISSSAHIELIPWLLGWDYVALDDELRKSFEVALHAGTAMALVIALRHELLDDASFAALASVPPALAGYAFERPIERRLGTPATIAAALFGGALVMAWADRRPQLRRHDEADAHDALWLGAAQAAALVPGVSRNGATLATARMRRFTRAEASRLSRRASVPVIAGASALKGVRMARRGVYPGMTTPWVAGVAASFGSTLASTWLMRRLDRDRSLWPYALYRSALAAVVLARLRSATSTTMSP